MLVIPRSFLWIPKNKSLKTRGKPINTIVFKSMVGGLRYLVHMWPDIAYAVGIVSRHMERPKMMHLNVAKRILWYVKGTVEYGLVYSAEGRNNVLTGYSDSDLAGHVDDRKSTGGCCGIQVESRLQLVGVRD